MENKFTLTSPFGMRDGKPHNGLDYAAPKGTKILAQEGGKVIYSGFGIAGSGYGGYGNTIHIQGKNGMSYLYAHNSQNLVHVGQEIKKGDVIGLVGSTGDSSGPHVHYEVRKDGKAIDPKHADFSGDGTIPATTGNNGMVGDLMQNIIRASFILLFMILAVVFFMKAFPVTDKALKVGTDLASPVKKIKMVNKLRKLKPKG